MDLEAKSHTTERDKQARRRQDGSPTSGRKHESKAISHAHSILYLTKTLCQFHTAYISVVFIEDPVRVTDSINTSSNCSRVQQDDVRFRSKQKGRLLFRIS